MNSKPRFRFLIPGLAVFAAAILPASASATIPSQVEETEQIASAKCVASEWRDKQGFRAKVIRAVDGDTVKIDLDRKQYSVRFLSIDTPETHFNGQSQGPWGEKAAQRLAEMLPAGSLVDVMFDAEKCDSYGRFLGYVLIGQYNTNLMMAEEGLAVNYCIFPNITYCAEMGAATGRAIAAARGFFSDRTVELPYEWRRRVSGRPHDKLIGSVVTKRVYAPGSYDRVPISERVFFFKAADVRPPYMIAR